MIDFPYEDNIIEYKSIKKIRGSSSDFSDLSKTCVCLANSQGGYLIIGIEDGEKEPPSDQLISSEEVNKVIQRLRSLTDSVGLANPEIYEHYNGGQYFSIRIFPSLRTIASTSEGKIFIRIGDSCQPVRGEDIANLANEKNAFQWELITPHRIRIKDIYPGNLTDFVSEIRTSNKVSDFIKRKSDKEILEYYKFIDGEYLTNLGILWLGDSNQRSKIAYPITVQYIVYNEKEEKVRKETWHSNELNPKQLLIDIEKKAVELNYFSEIPDGLYRKQIRHYPKEVLRELLVNAFAHKSFTMSGDIFIQLYPDRLEIFNPGGLPLGITKNNILHERQRRNPHLINIFHDLGLMEGEGSGYDLIYEKLSRDGKEFPLIESDYNKVKVTVKSAIIDGEVLSILDYLAGNFDLTQKEFIVLGVIARKKKILPTQLSEILQLNQEDRLRSWVSSLIEKEIIVTHGVKKGTHYLLNPKILASAKLNIKPSLKTIEPHKLRALIEEDLKINPNSSISEIAKRLEDADLTDIRNIVYKLVHEGGVEPSGSKKDRKYSLAKKK